MKKIIVVLLLFICTTIKGQEKNYYLDQDTVSATTATYYIKRTLLRDGAIIKIGNVNNKLDTVRIRRNDGKPCVSAEV